jgi:hypothetical protein
MEYSPVQAHGLLTNLLEVWYCQPLSKEVSRGRMPFVHRAVLVNRGRAQLPAFTDSTAHSSRSCVISQFPVDSESRER